MSCIVENYLYLVIKLDELVVEHRFYKLQRSFRILYRIQRLYRRLSCSGIFLGLPFSILFVNICTVLKHYFKQVCCSICAVNGSLESSLYQQRNSAAVVNMGMAQDYAFNLLRVKGERLLVELFHLFTSLELSAVQQNFMIVSC